jgi:toxin ParE1/3/4
MPHRRVIFSQPAQQDITSIEQFSATNWGTGQARSYVAAMRNSIELLATFPERGRIAGGSDPDLRVLVYNKHLVYYRLLETSIEVVRIVHERMDQSAYQR